MVGVAFVVAILVALVLCVVETAVLFPSASLFAVSHRVTSLSTADWLCAVNFAGITFVATAEVVAGLFAVFFCLVPLYLLLMCSLLCLYGVLLLLCSSPYPYRL